MKKIITAAFAALALTGGAAESAEAAPIRECGHWSVGHAYVSDATTRNVQLLRGAHPNLTHSYKEYGRDTESVLEQVHADDMPLDSLRP